jgi:hypothetical protein
MPIKNKAILSSRVNVNKLIKNSKAPLQYGLPKIAGKSKNIATIAIGNAWRLHFFAVGLVKIGGGGRQ